MILYQGNPCRLSRIAPDGVQVSVWVDYGDEEYLRLTTLHELKADGGIAEITDAVAELAKKEASHG